MLKGLTDWYKYYAGGYCPRCGRATGKNFVRHKDAVKWVENRARCRHCRIPLKDVKIVESG